MVLRLSFASNKMNKKKINCLLLIQSMSSPVGELVCRSLVWFLFVYFTRISTLIRGAFNAKCRIFQMNCLCATSVIFLFYVCTSMKYSGIRFFFYSGLCMTADECQILILPLLCIEYLEKIKHALNFASVDIYPKDKS